MADDSDCRAASSIVYHIADVGEKIMYKGRK